MCSEHYLPRRLNYYWTAKTVNKTSALYNLCSLLASVGVLRGGGELAHASFTEDRKHINSSFPVSVTWSVIRRVYHAMSGHSGKGRVLSGIWSTHWLVRGRAKVWACLQGWMLCKKHCTVACEQQTDLLSDHVSAVWVHFRLPENAGCTHRSGEFIRHW